ncbi:hypothetical protein [Vibrio chaetopteri]|uniref:Uncharacterized protein n=1 Tax=Vibrio chaetopteri TaxID=3016528 RepID=A0AAU8BQ64_9VIBR
MKGIFFIGSIALVFGIASYTYFSPTKKQERIVREVTKLEQTMWLDNLYSKKEEFDGLGLPEQFEYVERFCSRSYKISNDRKRCIKDGKFMLLSYHYEQDGYILNRQVFDRFYG